VPDISILYDQSESDELGIKLTAQEMGIDLGYIPFFKTAFTFGNNNFSLRTIGKDYTKELQKTRVVLNRCQSKSRRIFCTTILESLDKKTLNPLSVEENCRSKLKTLLGFRKRGIKIPKTVYVSPNVMERIGLDRFQDNAESISVLLKNGLESDQIVIKPDAGSHGNGVSLSNNMQDLKNILRATEQGITNPSGILGQELIQKWFYDLRIIVKKENKGTPFCHSIALARGGFKEFRTNTFLGNMVVRVNLPETVQRTAEKCAEILAEGASSYVIALDAMPSFTNDMNHDEEEIRRSFKELEIPFEKVSEVKKMPDKKANFLEYTNAINRAYERYMDTDPYRHIESVVNSTLADNAESVVFHEGNACPEFWEQTRVVAGINLSVDLLECAESHLDS
jgi:glutathione synthase/RimK-type ligase-like ATP-grasp enzyme